MDLDRIKEFIEIAEAGSFREAAKRLHISPSVLSARFQTLEKSLGTRLLERNNHSIRLTDSGRLILRESSSLMSSYRDVQEALRDMKGHTYRSMKIMLCGQTMPTELGPFLDRYCREHPRLFLNLYDEDVCTIREGLMSGSIDLAFAIGRMEDFQDIPGRKIITCYRNMLVHLPNDHRLASGKSVAFSDLEDESFILYPKMKETCVRDLQISMLRQSGIRYSVYDGEASPSFFDLLVPIGKGVRLWNWNEFTAPNTSLITISDSGYEAYVFMLYLPDSDNKTLFDVVDGFLDFRKGRK